MQKDGARLLQEFDGVVGRSEGEGSAGARRGSCGCHLCDPRIRVLGACGEALRLRSEFDGVVGRSEGEGSAGARRGSCGCHLCDPPTRRLGAGGEAREPSVQRPYSSCRRRIYRSSQITKKNLVHHGLDAHRGALVEQRHLGASMCLILIARGRGRIEMNHNSTSVPASSGPPSFDTPDPMPGSAELVCGRGTAASAGLRRALEALARSEESLSSASLGAPNEPRALIGERIARPSRYISARPIIGDEDRRERDCADAGTGGVEAVPMHDLVADASHRGEDSLQGAPTRCWHFGARSSW